MYRYRHIGISDIRTNTWNILELLNQPNSSLGVWVEQAAKLHKLHTFSKKNDETCRVYGYNPEISQTPPKMHGIFL